MTNKIILNPDGQAVNLDDIRYVSTVHVNDNLYYFDMKYKGLGDNTMTFVYRFSQYNDSKEDLLNKVKNIRMEILKRMNDGENVTEVLGGINLKKNGN